VTTTGISFRHSDCTVTKSCQVCGATFASKTYEKVVNCPDHRIKRKHPKPALDNRRIAATCEVCGASYECNKVHYDYLARFGRQHLCPACVKAKNKATNKAHDQRKHGADRITEWVAPCRMTIVPKRAGFRSRCAPALAGRCPRVDDCVTFAANADWDGWTTKKDGRESRA